ncbi:hypothetical protein LTR93_012055, partial [Exophiala xenobiotica]
MPSCGIGPPWKLTPRGIPPHHSEQISIKALHNVKSPVGQAQWEAVLLGANNNGTPSLTLSRGTDHHVEIELASHSTAFVKFMFSKPERSGTQPRDRYSECYEDEPFLVAYLRRKGDRTDDTKGVYGPCDVYTFGGPGSTSLKHEADEQEKEISEPFHFRTFRIMSIDIKVTEDTDLVFYGLGIWQTNYDLDVAAEFKVGTKTGQADLIQALWTTSIRTLKNCMHDTYEDCPFYEQLQYAMDTRSSILFTYCVSGDDRLARQAICQLYNSFQPALGLTASRAPSHQLQIIPHFSLYWICMVFDHYRYFGDELFTSRFLGVIDAVLRTFDERIDRNIGLIRASTTGDQWDFTNPLYAYTLKYAASCLQTLNLQNQAQAYLGRAKKTVEAIEDHCFDGHFFADGLATSADTARDYSPHSQIWAVLCGAATGSDACNLLKSSLTKTVLDKGPFDQPSVAMSFYTLRALSELGGVYDELFDSFWDPWREQLSQNVTTWVEDQVSQRSDCHAWGSAPLHEFMAEVAGISPAEPGFRSISFKPRLAIFSSIKAQMPINGLVGKGMNDVQWERQGTSTEISFSITAESGSKHLESITTYVVLPD